jgi:hypothetical protein
MNGQDTIHHLETIVKPEIIQDIYQDRLKRQHIQFSEAHSHQQKPSITHVDTEITPEGLNSYGNMVREGEYGNETLKLTNRYNKDNQLNEITTGMKEIYRALRNRDTSIDETLDAKVI